MLNCTGVYWNMEVGRDWLRDHKTMLRWWQQNRFQYSKLLKLAFQPIAVWAAWIVSDSSFFLSFFVSGPKAYFHFGLGIRTMDRMYSFLHSSVTEQHSYNYPYTLILRLNPPHLSYFLPLIPPSSLSHWEPATAITLRYTANNCTSLLQHRP